MEYCGKFAIDQDVELLDGSGTVHIDTLHIRIFFRTADWGATPVICDSPRPVIEVWIWADIGSESVFLFAGTQTGDTTPITSFADGWIYEPTISVGWPTPPPTTVIFYPPLFDPGMPVIVSPRATDSGGSPGGSYVYPERNRTLLLSCSRRKEHTEDLECGDGEGEPPSYETSSFWGTSSYGGSSGGDTSGGTTSGGGGSGGTSGGSSGGGGTEIYLEALVCGTNAPSGKFYEFVGVDHGTVWKQPDGTCLWADIIGQEATATSTPAVDLSNPQLSCALCYGEALCFFAQGTARRTLINRVAGRFNLDIDLFHSDGTTPSVFNGEHELSLISASSCTVWTFGKDIIVPGVSKIELRLVCGGVFFGGSDWHVTGQAYTWDVSYFEYPYDPGTDTYDYENPVPVYDWVPTMESFYEDRGDETDEFPIDLDAWWTGSYRGYVMPSGDWSTYHGPIGSVPPGIHIEVETGPTDDLDICEDCET